MSNIYIATIAVSVICIVVICNFQRIKTIISLKKLNKDKFYSLNYYGDYPLKEYLEKGSLDESEFYDFLNLKKQNLFINETNPFACTCFSAFGNPKSAIFGRNFDWEPHTTLLLKTRPKNGYSSISMVDVYYLGINKRVNLFNIINLLKSPFFPMDGMNECGLAVGILRVPHGKVEENSSKVWINSVTAVRALLDYAKDVDEAIELFKKFNIFFLGNVPIHYMLSDQSGKSAVIEFVDGKMQVLRNNFRWQVSTNFILFGSKNEGSGADRYYNANKFLRKKNGIISNDEAMNILSQVVENTAWSAVYNMCSGKVDICVGEDFKNIKTVNFKMHNSRDK